MSEQHVLHRIVTGPTGAPTIVLSNSLGTALEMWDPQVAALADRFRVVRYDSRGHGRSPVPPGPYRVADLGRDLLGLLDELGVARAHLCGLSLGGLTSLWAAAHAPERVASLTVLSAPARFAKAAAERERAALVRQQGTTAIADAVVARWVTPAFATAHPDVVAQLRAMIAATPAEGYAGCCEAVAEADLRPALARITAPALCIAAADDPALPVAAVEALAAGLPDARFATVANAAHLVNVERPDEVTRLILDHVARAEAAQQAVKR